MALSLLLPNCNRTNHGPHKHIKIPLSPHHEHGIYVWRQQICDHKLNHNSIHPQQKAQHVSISQGEQCYCCQDPRVSLVLIQPKQKQHAMLSKHWNYMKVKDTIRELFDYQGDITLHKPD